MLFANKDFTCIFYIRVKVKRNLLVAINLGSRIFRIVGVGKTQPDDSYGKLIDLRISKLKKGRESEKLEIDKPLEKDRLRIS